MRGVRRAPSRARRWALSVRFLTALLMVGLSIIAPPRQAAAQNSSGEQFWFESTGQALGSPFFEGWQERGGLGEVGAPVGAPVQRGDRWAQWFEFSRLEAAKPSLDQASAADIQVAPIGLDLATRLGLTRWHPAFQPFRGQVTAEIRAFDNGHTLANAFKSAWEDGATGERLGLPISEEFRLGETVYQFFERGALSWNPNYGVGLVPLGYVDAALQGGLRLNAQRPEGVAAYDPTPGGVPIVASGGQWIDVNLSAYTLTAYVGETPVFQTVIVDGAADYPTATGTFYIYTKMYAQTMRGRNVDGSEYITEDVPYVMYFYADFALHGAYWRSSFGYSGSHGCVNMPVGDAAWLYEWAPVGTRVEVHY